MANVDFGGRRAMSSGQQIDVEQIMAQIREDIVRKRRTGESPILTPKSAPASDGTRGADLAALQTYADVYSIDLVSHRMTLGPFIAFVKKVLRQLLNPILTRQVAYNATNTKVVTNLGAQVDGLRREQEQLREEVLTAQRQTLLLRKDLVAQGQALRGQGQLREDVLAAKGQLADVRAQVQTLQAMREQVSRAERKLRRILYTLAREDQQAGETLDTKANGALSEKPEYGFDYFGFEERFRGTEDVVKERQQPYVEYFRGARDVVDLACGRGEFLELLTAAGVGAKGIERDLDMVLLCREKGLDVVNADAFSYLESVPDEPLSG